MIRLDSNTKSQLLDLWKSKNIGIEGNLLKVIDPELDGEFDEEFYDEDRLQD